MLEVSGVLKQACYKRVQALPAAGADHSDRPGSVFLSPSVIVSVSDQRRKTTRYTQVSLCLFCLCALGL